MYFMYFCYFEVWDGQLLEQLTGIYKTSSGCTGAKHKCENKDSLKLLEICLTFIPVATQCMHR